jgi:hypothetical protein
MACGMPVTLSLGEKPAMTWVSRLSRVASAVSGGVRSSGGPPRHPSMSKGEVTAPHNIYVRV